MNSETIQVFESEFSRLPSIRKLSKTYVSKRKMTRRIKNEFKKAFTNSVASHD